MSSPTPLAPNWRQIWQDTQASLSQGGSDARAIAMDHNRGNAHNDTIAQDLATMEYAEFVQKYGPEVADTYGRLQSNRMGIDTAFRGPRSVEQSILDTGLGIAAGASKGVLGAVGFAASVGPMAAIGGAGKAISHLTDDPAAAELTGKMQDISSEVFSKVYNRYSDWTDTWGSDGRASVIQRMKESAASDARGNAILKAEDAQSHSPLVTGARAVGRDTLSAVSRAFERGDSFTESMSQVVGSLLPVAAVGKYTQGLNAGIRTATSLGTIGSMEGSGVFAENYEKAINTPFSVLEAHSEDYRTRIANGEDPTQVRKDLAYNAALAAGATQFTAAALISKMSGAAKIETDLLTRPQGLISSGIREGIEEAPQGATGALAGNYAQQALIDNRQQLTEGVGSALGEGLVFGSLAPATVQGPGRLVSTISNSIANMPPLPKEVSDSPTAPENVARSVSELSISPLEASDLIRPPSEMAPYTQSKEAIPLTPESVSPTASPSILSARGTRNNNPGNIRISDDHWQGAIGDDGAFVRFATPELGVRAMTRNLMTYANRDGLNTIRGIITKWAPPSDNNDTEAYINDTVKAMGVTPDTELDLTNPEVMGSLVKAMITKEVGGMPYTDSVIASGVISGIEGSSLFSDNVGATKPVVNTEKAIPLAEKISRDLSITPDFFSSISETAKSEINNRYAELAPLESPNYAEAILNMANVASDNEATQGTRTEAALILLREKEKMDQLFGRDIPFHLKQMEDSPKKEDFAFWADTYKQLATVDTVVEAVQWATEKANSITNESAPEDVRTAARVAETSPHLVEPEVAERILYHSEGDESLITPSQRTSLQAIASLKEAREAYRALLEDFAVDQDLTEKSAIVMGHVTTKALDTPFQSMTQYVRNINDAVRSGNNDLAQAQFNKLKDFAQHQINKATALSESADNAGDPISYVGLNIKGEWGERSPVNFNYADKSGNSKRFAQQVHAESIALNTFVNTLEKVYPHLKNGKSLVNAPISPEIGIQKPVKQQEVIKPVSENKAVVNTSDTLKRLKELKEEQKAIKPKIKKIAKKPFTSDLIKRFGRLHPDSETAKELKALGVTAKVIPGLFSKTGKKGYDNLPHSEFENKFDLKQDDNGYVDHQSIIDNILQEANGEPILSSEEASLLNQDAALTKEISELSSQVNPSSVNKAPKASKKGKKNTAQKELPFEKGIATEPLKQPSETIKKEKPVEVKKEDLPEPKKVEEKVIVEEPIEPKKVEESEDSENDVSPETIEKKFLSGLADFKSINPKAKFSNIFKSVYEFPKKTRNKFLALENPIEDFMEILKDKKKVAELLGLKNTYSQEKLDVLRSLLSQIPYITKAVDESVRSQISKPITAKTAKGRKDLDGMSLIERMNRGLQSFTDFRQYLIMHFYDYGNDTFTPNKFLFEMAALAGLEFVLADHQADYEMDLDKIARILRVTPQEAEKHQHLFNNGLNVAFFKQRLGQAIKDAWGVKDNSSGLIAHQDGLAEAFAAELIDVFANMGLLEVETYNNNEKGKDNVTLNFIIFKKNDKVKESLAKLGDGISILSQMINPENATHSFVGNPIDPKDVPKTVHRNGQVKLTANLQKAARRAQSVPFYVNNNYRRFLLIGKERYAKIKGIRQPLASDHIQFQESLKGIWSTFEQAYDDTIELIDNVRSFSKENKTDFLNTPVYFKRVFTSVGRMMMVGKGAPQSNKTARETIMSNRSILDLQNNQQHKDDFWRAIAQGIGLKTDRLFGHESQEIAMERTLKEGGQNYELVNELAKWLASDVEVMPESIDKLIPVGSSDQAIQAYIHAALYKNAAANGTLASFESNMYLEADGVTNGPINSLLLFATGMYNAGYLKLAAKGGAFIGLKDMTINKYRNMFDKVDLYQELANRTVERINNWLNEAPPDVRAYTESLFRVLSVTNPDVNMADDKVSFLRGFFKNPLTIKVYNAGANGIADNIVNNILYDTINKKGLYKDLSEIDLKNEDFIKKIREKSPNKFSENYTTSDFIKDINTLINGKILIDPKTKALSLSNKGGVSKFVNDLTQGALNAVLSPEEFKQISSGVKTIIVDNMIGALDTHITKDTNRANKALQIATQVQSLLAKHMYEQLVKESIINDAKKAIDNGDTPSAYNYITRGTHENILKKVFTLFPEIEVGDQRYLFNAKNAGAMMFEGFEMEYKGKKYSLTPPQHFSQNVRGQYTSLPIIFAPKEAGVSAVPGMTIGQGDGTMVADFYQTAPDEFINSTSDTYDGMHISVEKMGDASEFINGNIYSSWTRNNLMRPVRDSFITFMRTGELSNIMSDQLAYEISKAREQTPAKPQRVLTQKEAINWIDKLVSELETVSEEIEVRQEALRRSAFSIDQLASAERPFNREVADPVSPSDNMFEEVANNLNLEIEKITEERKKVKSKSVDLNDEFKSLQKESGGMVMEARDVVKSLVNNKQLPNEQSNLVKLANRVLSKLNYKIVYGTHEEIQQWEENNLSEKFRDTKAYKGKFISTKSHKLILLKTSSSETVIHELLHAALLDKLSKFFSKDRDKLSEIDSGAIKRLQQLMKQWLNTDFKYDTVSQTEAANNAKRAIEQANNPADKLSEFIAWSMSNQDLIEVNSKVPVVNFMARVSKMALDSIKSLIFEGNAPRVGKDMASNIRFNTLVLLSEPSENTSIGQEVRDVISFHDTGTNTRLDNLIKNFEARIVSHLDKTKNIGEMDAAMVRALATWNRFKTYGFNFTEQETTAFNLMVKAFATTMEIDSRIAENLQKVFDHVLTQITAEDFLATSNSKEEAENKYKVLNGHFKVTKTKQGDSTMLSGFLALAVTNEEFRNVLATKTLPKAERSKSKNLDAYLTENAAFMFDKVGSLLRDKESQSRDVVAALDRMVAMIGVEAQDSTTRVELAANGLIDKGNEYLKKGIQTLADKSFETASKGLTSDKEWLKKTSAVAAGLAAIASDKYSGYAAEGVLSFMNKFDGAKSLREVIGEFIGVTDSNYPLYSMINRVKSLVDQTRQIFREQYPAIIKSKFKVAPTKDEWRSITNSLLKTDISVFDNDITSLLYITDSRARKMEIKDLETRDGVTPYMKKKAKELALYMVTGKVSNQLARNGYAIAMEVFNPNRSIDTSRALALEDTISKLVSLYALELTDQKDLEVFKNLSEKEKEGISYVMAIAQGLRKDEMSKVSNSSERINSFQGFIKMDPQEGTTLIVAPTSKYKDLINRGYIKLDKYHGSDFGYDGIERAYYFSPSTGSSKYNKGIIQTTHDTVWGIDPLTGHPEGISAGRITDKATLEFLKDLHIEGESLENDIATNGEYLMPILGKSGNIIGYDRAINPEHLAKLNYNHNTADILGAWAGRISEEKMSRIVNEESIKKLSSMWSKDKNTSKKVEYVKISKDSKDPLILDTWNLIPSGTKKLIKAEFDEGELMVRKDMVPNVLGYRSASIGDFWTGKSNWSPETQKAMKYTLTAVFGKNTYKYLTQAESLLQSTVTEAKVLIVVKSVIVPMANLLSTLAQSLANGVSLRTMVREVPQIVQELNGYTKRRIQEVNLLVELAEARGSNNNDKIITTRARLQAIKDANMRMKIWPLIENGEFTAITEGGIDQTDLDMANGSWDKMVQSAVAKMPSSMVNAFRYGMVTRDTPLFKFLAKSVQYGDFIGKALVYSHEINKGTSKEATLRKVTEEFVAYNFLPGRTRTALESNGLLWFYHFKIRIAKIAARLLRDNPLRAIMIGGGLPNIPFLGPVGLPWEDSIINKIVEGDALNSIGLDPMFSAPSLNPWYNLAT